MVTLSACQTNVGPLLQGEGLASLAKGFSYAGAKSIITSMWDVEDHAAKDLMVEFYHQLEDRQRKSVSLHVAKLQYLTGAQSSMGHPYFWATFIAIGDMSPLQIQDDTAMFYLLVILSLILLTITISYFRRRWKH
jgi:CHAT domain-containing protein